MFRPTAATSAPSRNVRGRQRHSRPAEKIFERPISQYSRGPGIRAESRLSLRSSPDGIDFAAGKLSGGNLQKLILGREIMRGIRRTDRRASHARPRCLRRRSVWRELLRARQEGKAILLISAELEELLNLADQHCRDVRRPHHGHCRCRRRFRGRNRPDDGGHPAGRPPPAAPDPANKGGAAWRNSLNAAWRPPIPLSPFLHDPPALFAAMFVTAFLFLSYGANPVAGVLRTVS